MNKIISENINLILKNKNLSQQELANRSGISRQSINLILSFNKTSNPKVSSLITIAHALDIDFPQLFSRNIDLDKPFNKIMTAEKYNNILIQNLKMNYPDVIKNLLVLIQEFLNQLSAICLIRIKRHTFIYSRTYSRTN